MNIDKWIEENAKGMWSSREDHHMAIPVPALEELLKDYVLVPKEPTERNLLIMSDTVVNTDKELEREDLIALYKAGIGVEE